MTTPPPGLSPSGLKKWDKTGQYSWLTSRDFESLDVWLDYKDDQELSFYRNKLLDGVADHESIDPQFLRNLCRLLANMQEEIDDKVSKCWD